MRICCLTHVPFEGPANVASWATFRGHSLVTVPVYEQTDLPGVESFDWLVAMGGPMSVQDEQDHPWLTGEKRLIRSAIDAGRRVLGVCLGAQLMAEVLGARVAPNRCREVGWFPVTLTSAGAADPLMRSFPPEFTAFHWHGDRFEIPPSADLLAGSEACDHQAFSRGQRVLGLQFHLDYTPESIELMVRHCGGELGSGEYVQPVAELTARPARTEHTRQLLFSVLDAMAAGDR